MRGNATTSRRDETTRGQRSDRTMRGQESGTTKGQAMVAVVAVAARRQRQRRQWRRWTTIGGKSSRQRERQRSYEGVR